MLAMRYAELLNTTRSLGYLWRGDDITAGIGEWANLLSTAQSDLEFWMTPDYDDEPNSDYWAIADAIDLEAVA
jgi:hypothetical protein